MMVLALCARAAKIEKKANLGTPYDGMLADNFALCQYDKFVPVRKVCARPGLLITTLNHSCCKKVYTV
uniref:Uncharacterized protein n=1 Tax=Tetranychus urticae TaxID=32264 RepID=T1L5S1_TETUR